MRPLRAAPDPVVIRAFWCYYLCIRRLWRAKFDIDQRQHADPSAQSAPVPTDRTRFSEAAQKDLTA